MAAGRPRRRSAPVSQNSAQRSSIPQCGGERAWKAAARELANTFIAQLVGRQRLKLLPAAEAGRLYNDHHAVSRIADLDAPDLNLDLYPRLVGAHLYEVLLEPGEILFLPLAWWHQVKALDFSVTVTYTDFRWPNDAYATYPTG